jgi:uncharacterized protein
MKYVPTAAMVLVLVGALNWGLVGLGAYMGGQNWNVVGLLFGTWPGLVNLVYVLVGLAGVWALYDWYAKMSKK